MSAMTKAPVVTVRNDAKFRGQRSERVICNFRFRCAGADSKVDFPHSESQPVQHLPVPLFQHDPGFQCPLRRVASSVAPD